MRQRWSVPEINAWYEDRPWITGCNFIPSGATHGTFWLFQEHDHQAAFRDAAREIALAHWLGLNSIRFFLPFEVWRHQRDAFFAHLEELLALLDGYGMTMMPVLFNDCTVPKRRYHGPTFGPQPEPVPGFFGGTAESPFDDDVQGGDSVGYLPFDEPGGQAVMREYVQSLTDRYGQDPRILIWNVWNEMDSQRGDRSLAMMTDVFGWLREADVAQPLTAEIWGGEAESALSWLLHPTSIVDVERRAAELSDIVTFHFYGDYTHAKQFIPHLRAVAGGRPLINTEWMHRPFGSLIETHLPLWHREEIGSYFFGLVNGKPQFDVVWTFIKDIANVDTSLWMHDIVHADFSPYDPDEIAVLRRYNLGEAP